MTAEHIRNLFLSKWKEEKRDEAFRAEVVSYADDFVILSRGRAAQSLEWSRRVLEDLGLRLNEEKTVVRDAWREQFDFLGYTFGPHWSWNHGRWYLGASPSKRSVGSIRETVRQLLRPFNLKPWPEVRDALNEVLRGWAGYFSFGQKAEAYRAVERYVYERVRGFLARRHKVLSRGTRAFPWDMVFGELGIIELRRPLYASQS